ncbi:MAG: HAD-IIIA family hydrolase [Candidatus Omnitrophica bacterium]|jgi:D-glycero-D-manno-heptose 1,7-bisphosphate phosphatase|nr:HAD-IIIA family hydrolase [Candidatus Omnitrophota bacterium]
MIPDARELQVVVLMGGKGTRLGGVIGNLPKAMAEVEGKPFFSYQFDLLRLAGFKKFIFCVGFGKEYIYDFFGDGVEFGVKIEYSPDPPGAEGTASALKNAMLLLEDDFMLSYGDSFMDMDYQQALYNYWLLKKSSSGSGMMCILKNNNLYDKSNIVFENNRIVKYDKKSSQAEMDYIDYGTSFLNKALVDKIPASVGDLSDFYSMLVRDGLLAGFVTRKRFREIGNSGSLEEFRNFIKQRLSQKNKAIFLDRDGTLNKFVFNDNIKQFDSPLKPDEFCLIDGVFDALKQMKKHGFLLIVVTNQPAAAKGKTTLKDIYAINNRMLDLFRENGVEIDDVMVCPHHQEGSDLAAEQFLVKKCQCRKPQAGLLETAIDKYNIDIGNSYMVGDSSADILAAKKKSVRSVFIGKYKKDDSGGLQECKPDLVFENILDFAGYLRDTKE